MAMNFTLLDTHIFPCKYCQQSEEQREEIEFLLRTFGARVNERFNNILIGMYHILLHVVENDRLWILWLSDNLIVRELEQISDALVQTFNVGVEMNHNIKQVIEKK